MALGGQHVNDSSEHWTPFIKAAECNWDETVALVIGAQADVNAKTKKGRNVVSIAAAPPNGWAPALIRSCFFSR